MCRNAFTDYIFPSIFYQQFIQTYIGVIHRAINRRFNISCLLSRSYRPGRGIDFLNSSCNIYGGDVELIREFCRRSRVFKCASTTRYGPSSPLNGYAAIISESLMKNFCCFEWKTTVHTTAMEVMR
ncbi:PREDICTED: uncharacterized protein LOC108377493 isoform X2 [Rhagoletis zephyria]|uniref:uncharacterized protein LOC108377493 isoform X2 n=1 Tax=Rhagoletis zephyria TaxID=28612 RepID=UPI00081173BA|nr:PREDICTED: uncharacterized protein LOC108377493 isoform X2 [Rhagoletis zephyria]